MFNFCQTKIIEHEETSCWILLCLSLLFCGSGTTLLALSKTSVVNHFTTGVVDIELEEYEIQDGQEVPYENPKEVMPGTHDFKNPTHYKRWNTIAMYGQKSPLKIWKI